MEFAHIRRRLRLNYTDRDWQDLEAKERQILSQLDNAELQGWKTKSQLIKEYVSLERIKLEAGKLPIESKNQFCSYIWTQLTEVRKVKIYQDGDFYSLFEPTEKHSEKNPISVISRQEISSTLQTAQEQIKEIKQKISDSYTDYLEYSQTTLTQCYEILDDLISKYPEFKEEIRTGLGSVDKLMEEEKEFRAAFEDIASNLDLRNKALAWKKTKAFLLEAIEYNIAKVANLIHVSPKHLSANLLKHEKEDLLEKTNWFDTIDLELAKDYKKGEIISIKINEWYNRQVERLQLSLPFKKPKIEYIAKI